MTGHAVPPGVSPAAWARMSWHARAAWARRDRARRAVMAAMPADLAVKPGPLTCCVCGAEVGARWAGFTDGTRDYCARSCGPVLWVEA